MVGLQPPDGAGRTSWAGQMATVAADRKTSKASPAALQFTPSVTKSLSERF